MSLQYSNTTTLGGILQLIEKECEFEYGYITGNPTRLKEWTAAVNLTKDEVLARIFKAGGTWQFDDSNHTDYPEISADLISGQRDYAFTEDENGNLVLDIFRVFVAGPDGTFREMPPVDKQTAGSDTMTFNDGQNATGTPTRHDKTANGILLDPIPNYNMRLVQEGQRGIKVQINREGSYWQTTDTTKKSGTAGLFDEIYVVGPSYKYALRKMPAKVDGLEARKLRLEAGIDQHYARRERDTFKGMRTRFEDNR